VGILVINPELTGKGLLSHKKNLDSSQSHLDYRGYSCHQRLLSTWHGTNHMMLWMKWWCTISMVKPETTLTLCILKFQRRLGISVLGYIHINSIHSGHLLLLILVGRWYSQFTTCHRGCVWGHSLCFYLRSYLVLIVQVRI
jgi:hypothetical protein